MPRDIPLSNGSMLVNFDDRYQLRDLYWPHVGQEIHTAGHPFRLGVWMDGTFSWIGDDGWVRSLLYDGETLVTKVSLKHAAFGLELLCNDAVDFHENLYVKKIEATAAGAGASGRQVRLFFTHDFHIYGHSIADSAYYEPERRALFHYKGARWFLINAAKGTQGGDLEFGLDQWAVGVKETAGKEGTWRDAEDGILSGNSVAQGSVDSAIGIHLDLSPGSRATVWYWIAAGSDFKEVTRINRLIRQKGPQTFIERTRHYWALWSHKVRENLPCLAPAIAQLYNNSLLILRTHVDNDGAIIAGADFDITSFARDTYAYMWGRDGAMASAALAAAGYTEVPRRFFEFCHKIITEEGYLLHKFNPSGSLASSWLGWYFQGRKVIPVQEDETALVLWALWRFFERFHEVEFIKPLYRGLIVRAANWLASFVDRSSGLPLPSWGLWEERWGVFSWTVAAVWAGLQAGARFAEAFGEHDRDAAYREAATRIKGACEERLWDRREGRFLSGLLGSEDGSLRADYVIDSSVSGLWHFGMFDADDGRVVATMENVRERLWVDTGVGGLARYENDSYQRSVDDRKVQGNPWFISTLWLAQWYIATAKSIPALTKAADLLRWAARCAQPSGCMAEQVHPYTHAPLSVSPLAWSHATLIAAVQEYGTKWESLSGKPPERQNQPRFM